MTMSFVNEPGLKQFLQGVLGEPYHPPPRTALSILMFEEVV